MREIKFRVWDKGEEEMIYQDEHISFCFADGFIGMNCDKEEHYECREWVWRGGVNCVVMQYTGLKDKNGKEIYEGDIVKRLSLIKSLYEMKYEVKFVKGLFRLVSIGKALDLPINIPEPLEVVGNVFENPELLGGKE